MHSTTKNTVSTEQFINTLSEYATHLPKSTDYISYGYQTGWLQDMDLSGRKFPLLRKNAARILHEFLQIELQEPDVFDVSAAYRLQDLFDCRTCVCHIMQIFAKGIMSDICTSDTRLIFGTDMTISVSEMTEILNRAFYSDLRIIPSPAEAGRWAVMLSAEDALNHYQNATHALLIDVRTYEEFTAHHLPCAIHIPMMDIIKNPYSVSPNRATTLLLYCNNGYQSSMAANCLTDAGYDTVYFFACE